MVTTLPTGINNVREGADIIIYPNPSAGLFNLKLMLRKDATVRISLINQIGQIVQSESMDGVVGNNEKAISVPGQGIYTLQIIIDKEVFIRRIIKE